MQWMSTTVDEAHDYRSRTKAWEAVFQICWLSRVFVCMSATPIFTGPQVSPFPQLVPSCMHLTVIGYNTTISHDVIGCRSLG